jgi:hypothetical protein
VPISRRQLLRLSDLKKFAPYVRPAGRKSEPVFRRSDVIESIRSIFGDLLPDAIAEIERSGFGKPRR